MDDQLLKVLVVDDEPLATERLQLLLARAEGVDLVGTASDGEAAVRMAEALQPAKVTAVQVVDPTMRAARVVVPDYQLSLAIGREGQNARLAARLTGWRIDIRPDSMPAEAAPPARAVTPSPEAEAAG